MERDHSSVLEGEPTEVESQLADLEPVPVPDRTAAGNVATFSHCATYGATQPNLNLVARKPIRQLDPHTINQIAAGEVVERPAAALKELLENSLDAGATSIEIDLEKSGKALIRVIDDGIGMDREAMALAMQRHATSKIASVEDLEHISTLGFRGEALPSIASVSRFELKSSQEEGVKWVARAEGGQFEWGSPEAGRRGTEVTVRDLFYNTPARLKFLKSDNVELGACMEAAGRLALSHPKVRFELRHNGRLAFRTDGSGEVLEAIAGFWCRDIANGLAQVDGDAAGVRVRGYVSPPYLTKPNRAYQFLFVNGRSVKSRALTVALDQAYRDMTPERRFPIVVLDLLIDPARLDVNVSPTKSEVRFQSEGAVFESLRYAIRGALLEQGMMPDAKAVATVNEALSSISRASHYLAAPSLEFGRPRGQEGLSDEGSRSLHDLPQKPVESQIELRLESKGVSCSDSEGAKLVSAPEHDGLALRVLGDVDLGNLGGAQTAIEEVSPGDTGQAEWDQGGWNRQPASFVGTGIERGDRIGASSPSAAGPGANAPSLSTGDSAEIFVESVNGEAVERGNVAVSGVPLSNGLDNRGATGAGTSIEGLGSSRNLDLGDELGLGTELVEREVWADRVARSNLDLGAEAGLRSGTGAFRGSGGQETRGRKGPLPFEELLDGLIVVGQAMETFIIAETRHGLVVIDQHVAHERILFEHFYRTQGRGALERQKLLTPLVLSLDKRTMLLLGDRLQEVSDAGFDVEPFGDECDLLVRAVPAVLRSKDPMKLLKNLIEDIAEGVARHRAPTCEQVWAMAACKMAVKAGDPLSHAEMEKLIQDLALTDNPYLCPHGRPITVTLDSYRLLKLFKRV